MKFDDLMKNASSYFYFFAMILIVILILKQLYIFEWLFRLFETLSPLWFGILIAVFLQPLISNKNNSTKRRIILFYGCFALLLISISALIVYFVFANLALITELLEKSANWIMITIEEINLSDSFDTGQLQGWLMGVSENLMPVFKNIINVMTTLFLSLMIAFFVSLEHSFFKNEFMKYVKDYRKFFHFYDIFSQILRQYITSTLLDMIYLIVSTSLILSLMKTPFALMLAVMLAFFNLFPYIGALLGSGLIVLIHFLFVKENTLLLIFLIFLNSQLESNIIHTWICNRTMKIHPLFLFLSLLIFDFFFGLIGVILSPIFAGMLQLAFSAYGQYLNEKNVGGWESLSSEKQLK